MKTVLTFTLFTQGNSRPTLQRITNISINLQIVYVYSPDATLLTMQTIVLLYLTSLTGLHTEQVGLAAMVWSCTCKVPGLSLKALAILSKTVNVFLSLFRQISGQYHNQLPISLKFFPIHHSTIILLFYAIHFTQILKEP
jgi:hypothetical protein